MPNSFPLKWDAKAKNSHSPTSTSDCHPSCTTKSCTWVIMKWHEATTSSSTKMPIPSYLIDTSNRRSSESNIKHALLLEYCRVASEEGDSQVKTFRGHPHFYWTDNEIAAARKYAEHYYLYFIDIDKIADFGNSSEVAVLGYEPTIIPNPSLLFNVNSQWTFQVQQYVFTLLSNDQIPQDWDSFTILIGCYNNEDHLKWILTHNLYNVRSQKDAPGAVTINNPLIRQANYLILYSIVNPRVFMFYSIAPSPYKVTKTEMLAQGYPNPHAFSYILHPIQKQLDSFHIDLTILLREVNHTSDRTYGIPLYLNGIQLRRFMVEETNLYETK